MHKDRTPMEYLSALAIAVAAGFLSATWLRHRAEQGRQKAYTAGDPSEQEYDKKIKFIDK